MQRSVWLTGAIQACALGVLLTPIPGESAFPAGSASAEESLISEVVVTAQRRRQPRLRYAGNIDLLEESTIDDVRHQHVHELLSRVAGVWVVRGSGQEHQTSMRSPVLSGGGSCGGFLVLEDGIPVRPAGFCTVNQLTEVNTEQARSIEVIRGPGNALYGSNALHGIINVLMPTPGNRKAPHVALEVGANDFIRARAVLPLDRASNWLASAVYADDGGFRQESGYRQGKMHVKGSGSLRGGDFTFAFTATDLQQDSAGFIFGKDAYKDPVLRRSNPDPEAFRNAASQRLYGIWTRSLPRFDLDIRPYLRRSEMKFSHHALPGKPVENNGHVSAGVVSAATFSKQGQTTVAGIDVEWSDVFLKQTQFEPAQGSPRARETRPQGKHYDYEVTSIGLAAFVQTEYTTGERFTLNGGLRLETVVYDYRNQMLAGNTRDDGTPCGFGGCLYSRPGNRTDSFTNFAPKVALSYRLNSETELFTSVASGFRVPQMLELYRLQNGQRVADLESERIVSMETGLRTRRRTWSADVVMYAMRKRNSVFRDAEGFNVSGARSRHIGIEAAFDWQITQAWSIALNATRARHRYDFNALVRRGERFIAGRDIDTAPRWLGNIDLMYAPNEFLKLGLQWSAIGAYYLEPENRFRYPGHALINLRAGLKLSSQLELLLRLNNGTDESVADRADFAGGNYRYLPGRGRELFAEIRYSPLRSP